MKIKKYINITLGCLLAALSFNIFMEPYNILPGGVSGISQIVDKFYPINHSIFILIFSIILLIVSYLCLGKEKTLNSIYGSILFPIFVYITSNILISYPIDIDNMLLASVFGGISFGFGLGLVFKENYTTGGTDIINQILGKYLHIGMGTGQLIVESTILIISSFVFGFSSLMYSIITVYLIGIMIDKVMLGISSSKSFYIITKEPDKIKEYILNTLNHGVTVIPAKGGIDGEKRNILLTVIPTRDYYKLKEGIKKYDNEAFFVVSDSYEVGGGR